MEIVVRKSASGRQVLSGDAAQTARTGEVLVAGKLVRISQRTAELTGISAREATLGRTAHWKKGGDKKY